MKKLFIASAAVAALFGPHAFAADMAVKAPPIAPPVYSWTGCYLGGNLGGAWAHKDNIYSSINGTVTNFPEGSTSVNDWAYGGQIGCDYQFNTVVTLGIRGMWDGSNMSGSNPWNTAAPFGGAGSNNYKIDSFGTVVAKLGYLLTPAVQIYAVGGGAAVRDSLTWNSSTTGTFATGSQTRTGADVGGGACWMFQQNFDTCVEYDHMFLGTKTLTLAGTGAAAGNTFTSAVSQSVDKILVMVDYRFNGR